MLDLTITGKYALNYVSHQFAGWRKGYAALGLPPDLFVRSELGVSRFRRAHEQDAAMCDEPFALPEYSAATSAFVYVMARWACNLKDDARDSAEQLFEAWIVFMIPEGELYWGSAIVVAGTAIPAAAHAGALRILVKDRRVHIGGFMAPGSRMRAASTRTANVVTHCKHT